MRALLAIDGSVSSDRARDLVGSLPWPDGTAIRVVAALEHGPELFGLPWVPVVPENAGAIEADLVTRMTNAIETAARDLGARRGVTVDHVLLRGHAARAIVDEAGVFEADLVIVGSRGHGAFESILLGSTSAEVVDHAPCPVLVARSSRLASVVLADDGSAGARDAAALVEGWPILSGLPVTVVGVADVGISLAGTAPGMYGEFGASYGESVEAARLQYREIAERTAARLARSGRQARGEVREGDAAAQIVALATGLRADLIVVGTRGHTGLTRMILGSVARKVLTHAPCSVLVVRQGARLSTPGQADQAAAG